MEVDELADGVAAAEAADCVVCLSEIEKEHLKLLNWNANKKIIYKYACELLKLNKKINYS